MDTVFSAASGRVTVELWLTGMGINSTVMPSPQTNWSLDAQYPPATPHHLALLNPTSMPKAVVILSRVTFSPEHLQGFAEREDELKFDFLHGLQTVLNRDFTEFVFEGTPSPTSCPVAFQVMATRYEDALSMDSLFRSISSVYKTELAGIQYIQRELGKSGPVGGGGGFFFKNPTMQ